MSAFLLNTALFIVTKLWRQLEVLWTDEWISKVWCTVGQSQRERHSPTLTTHEIKRQTLQPSFLGEIYNAEPTEIEVQCSEAEGGSERSSRGTKPQLYKTSSGDQISNTRTHARTYARTHSLLYNWTVQKGQCEAFLVCTHGEKKMAVMKSGRYVN